MTRPVYDCKDPNCYACRMCFHTREGLTAAVVEEAREVREAERNLNYLLARHADRPYETEEEDEARNNAVGNAEMDLMAMVVRLSNALGALDTFQSQPTV